MSIYSGIDRAPSPKTLLSFGAVVLGGTVVIGAVERFVLHRDQLAIGLWFAGAVVFALSFIRPVGRLLYIGWMALGITMGFVTAPIVLAVVFLVLVTPVAMVFKLMRRDAMKRSIDKNAPTYWEPYPEHADPASYLKQY